MDKLVSLRMPFPHPRTYEIVGANEDESVVRTLATTHGLYEPEIMLLLGCIVGPDAVCIDIGANIGTITIAMAALCTNGTVHAVEPIQRNYAFLERNLAASKLSNVIPFNGGIFSTNCVLRFHYVEQFAAGAFYSPIGISDSREQTVEVACLSLDTFVSNRNITRVDLIKIDVEGAEEDVLTGGANTLRRLRPNMIIEFNPLASSKFYGRNIRAIYDIVKDHGYVVSLIARKGGGLMPIVSYDQLLESIEKQGGIGDIFCFLR